MAMTVVTVHESLVTPARFREPVGFLHRFFHQRIVANFSPHPMSCLPDRRRGQDDEVPLSERTRGARRGARVCLHDRHRLGTVRRRRVFLRVYGAA